MVQLSYPGVYIQEVPSGVRTITGVSTSIGAFFGRASKGPINRAVRLFSYADYERSFGAPHPNGDLADAVSLFFGNGGTDCYVVRVAQNPAAASLVLENLAGQNVLVATAKAEGRWANTVRLEVDYASPTNPDELFNLRVIYEEGGLAVQTESLTGLSMDPTSPRFAPAFVSASSALITLALHPDADAGGGNDIGVLGNSFSGFSQSRRPFASEADVQAALDGLLNPATGSARSRFEISVDGTPYVEVDVGPWAGVASAALTAIEQRFQDRINAALDSVSPDANVSIAFLSPGDLDNLLTITAEGGTSSQASVRIRRGSDRDLAEPLMLGVDQGGIEPLRYSNFRPAPTAAILRLGVPASPADLGTLNTLAAMAVSEMTSLAIDGAAIDLSPAGANSIQTTGNGADPFHRSKTGYSTLTGDSDGVREKLKIIANAITNHPELPYRAELWGYTLAIRATGGTLNEQPASVSSAPGPTVFDTTSAFIRNTRQYTLGTGGASDFSNNGADGSDGIDPVVDSFAGSEAAQTGFYALDPVDLFNLMVIPRDEALNELDMRALYGKAAGYCQRRRAFLVIDSPATWTNATTGLPDVVQDTSKVGDLRGALTSSKSNAAVFYPRLRVRAGGLTRVVGAGGAIAGLMARTDANRGVWKAPAGIEAGINGASGVNVVLNDAQNGVLNKLGVNCIRVLPNGSLVNWGARTMDGDDDSGSEWKYIPIRRFALFLEESLYRGTRWAVFEPNDEPLWAQIRLNINAFMFSLFRQQAFQGSSPQEAYYVRCDKSTTTQDDRNKGIVNIEVGFAPLKPAEFVVIRIQQMAGEL
jgi:phage tail sheath protein FI